MERKMYAIGTLKCWIGRTLSSELGETGSGARRSAYRQNFNSPSSLRRLSLILLLF